MREIKFRAFDKVLGMKPVCLIDFTNNAFWVVGDYGNQYDLSFDNSPPMQYTGLKDKNGKEIYEGDIISCYWNGGGAYTPREDCPIVLNVVFDIKKCGFLPFADYDSDCDQYIVMSGVVVIGNIYENPELLKHE